MYWKPSDILFPRRCAVCDALLGANELYLCTKCVPAASPYTGGRCVVCGRANSPGNTICPDCARYGRSFDIAAAPYIYEDKIRSSLIRLKYGKRPEYASFFASEIVSFSKKLIEGFNADMILHVPAHAARVRDRGYDQALLIAAGISKLTKIPHYKKLLIRKRNTSRLAAMNAEERRKALKGAFALNQKPGKRVILVDDIFTTGATAGEISRLLKKNGTYEVLVLTAATGHTGEQSVHAPCM